MISLLDRQGVRHEIDLETWTSRCFAWVVVESDGKCSGKAELHIQVPSLTPVQELGSTKTHFVPGMSSAKADEMPFDESDEHITCLSCIGEPP